MSYIGYVSLLIGCVAFFSAPTLLFLSLVDK